MILPSVHINGTSAAALLSANRLALRAVKVAVDAVEAAAPNPRDFEVQTKWAVFKSQEEHAARIAKLHWVASELAVLCEHITDHDKAPPP